MNQFFCEYAEQCSGCPEAKQPYEQQQLQKTNQLKSLLNLNESEVEFISVGQRGLRDRMDATISKSLNSIDKAVIGFYDQKKALIDIPSCAQLSVSLSTFYQEFRKINWPISKGSFRLRTSPRGEWGAWLDFANVDIKNLLEEKRTLRELMQIARVEIGQRRKTLSDINGTLKLTEPELARWFTTPSLLGEESFDLFCHIGAFTQPSLRANSVLVKKALSFFKTQNHWQVLEYGSGCGNFTLPLAEIAKSVNAIETDPLSVEALKYNLKSHRFEDRVLINAPTLNKKNEFNLVVLDPPRSGCRSFLKEIIEMAPEYVVYISCFAETFAQEFSYLKSKYRLKELSILDQFPQSSHYEIVAILESISKEK